MAKTIYKAAFYQKETSLAPSARQTKPAVQQDKVCYGVLDCGQDPNMSLKPEKNIMSTVRQFTQKKSRIFCCSALCFNTANKGITKHSQKLYKAIPFDYIPSSLSCSS